MLLWSFWSLRNIVFFVWIIHDLGEVNILNFNCHVSDATDYKISSITNICDVWNSEHSSWWTGYHTRSLRSCVRYHVQHLKWIPYFRLSIFKIHCVSCYTQYVFNFATYKTYQKRVKIFFQFLMDNFVINENLILNETYNCRQHFLWVL